VSYKVVVKRQYCYLEHSVDASELTTADSVCHAETEDMCRAVQVGSDNIHINGIYIGRSAATSILELTRMAPQSGERSA